MTDDRGWALRRFETLQSRFERLLYDYDPDGMGSTVGAPLDEYSDVATCLIRALRDREVGVEFAEAVWDVIPGATVELVDEVKTTWNESAIS